MTEAAHLIDEYSTDKMRPSQKYQARVVVELEEKLTKRDNRNLIKSKQTEQQYPSECVDQMVRYPSKEQKIVRSLNITASVAFLLILLPLIVKFLSISISPLFGGLLGIGAFLGVFLIFYVKYMLNPVSS